MDWFKILVMIFWVWIILDSFVTDIELKKLKKRLKELEECVKENEE